MTYTVILTQNRLNLSPDTYARVLYNVCLLFHYEIITDIVEFRIKFTVLWHSRTLNFIHVDHFTIFCYISMDKFVYTAHKSFLILAIKGINFIPIIGLTEEIQNVYRVHVQQ